MKGASALTELTGVLVRRNKTSTVILDNLPCFSEPISSESLPVGAKWRTAVKQHTQMNVSGGWSITLANGG